MFKENHAGPGTATITVEVEADDKKVGSCFNVFVEGNCMKSYWEDLPDKPSID